MDKNLVKKFTSTQLKIANLDQEIEAIKAPLVEQVNKATASLVERKQKLIAEEAELRSVLQDAMEKNNVKKFENEVFAATYVKAGTRKTLDSKKLKEEAPGIYDKYVKESAVKASVRITLK